MSALLNMSRSLQAGREKNTAGAFAGAFFSNQTPAPDAGFVRSMRTMQLEAIEEAAGAATMTLDELLALAKGQADASKAGV